MNGHNYTQSYVKLFEADRRKTDDGEFNSPPSSLHEAGAKK